MKVLDAPLVLSLFPGADLLGRAFELHGASVVRGPDLLWGQDMRDWRAPPAGRFDGVIGGPPCQPFSRARNIGGSPPRHADGISAFWDVVRAARPAWAVMENVPEVVCHPDIPSEAVPIVLNDWRCGGLTHRNRVFYFWPRKMALDVAIPQHRDGKPAWSVLASSHKVGGRRKRAMHKRLSAAEAGRLQGWPEIVATIEGEAAPGRRGNRLIPDRLIVHYLGNGVPRAMGEWVARHVLASARGEPLAMLA